MSSLKKWYEQSPFLEGVSSAFDLFGTTGLTLEKIKKLHARRVKNNTIEHDLSLVAEDMQLAIDQYEETIKSSR